MKLECLYCGHVFEGPGFEEAERLLATIEAKDRELERLRASASALGSELALVWMELVKPVADAHVTHGEKWWGMRDRIERILREVGRLG